MLLWFLKINSISQLLLDFPRLVQLHYSKKILCSFVLLASLVLNILLGRLTMGGLPIQNSSSVISLQSQKDQSSEAVASGPDSKPRKKICCACPETKKLRDECIVEHGEAACGKWIEAHRKCLRAEGFNV
ncbi:UNVERIFIED_CONTAM: Cytochrome c oxidase copper chaperone 1 [Sesamum radiatum]|uniref:Cytochrome c oxidase copper chaperone 1 n=2 Tax=Sesamum TaxID=4181 RepID=A0AAW2K4Q1_SESRA